MTRRFYCKVLILLAIAMGVALAITHFANSRSSRTGLVREGRQPTGGNNAFHDDRREAVALTRHQAILPSARSAAADLQSNDEDESLGQSAAGVGPIKPASQEVAGEEMETEKAPRATRPTPKPKLAAGHTTVKETPRGPVATFQFSPTTTDPVGPVTIVAFLPPGSDAKILDLSPTQGTAYSEIDKRISENGWFAAFQGTPQEVTNLSFHLSVSKAAIALIKGNCGIEPFKIDLGSGR